METEYLSVPAEAAYEEAERRLRDNALQEKVATYLGNLWPAGFSDTSSPQAIYAPYLAKGSIVEVDYISKAAAVGFEPVVATYQQSEYVTANAALIDCYRAPLMLPKGQQTREWLVSEDQRCGPVGIAETKYKGLSIVNYWSGIRDTVLEEKDLEESSTVVDFSEWYDMQAKRFGWDGGRSKAPFYYRALLGLYTSGRAVRYAVPPTEFTDRVVLPAAKIAQDYLGKQPLIVYEIPAVKRDWSDLSFLDESSCVELKETGRIGSKVTQ